MNMTFLEWVWPTSPSIFCRNRQWPCWVVSTPKSTGNSPDEQLLLTTVRFYIYQWSIKKLLRKTFFGWGNDTSERRTEAKAEDDVEIISNCKRTKNNYYLKFTVVPHSRKAEQATREWKLGRLWLPIDWRSRSGSGAFWTWCQIADSQQTRSRAEKADQFKRANGRKSEAGVVKSEPKVETISANTRRGT